MLDVFNAPPGFNGDVQTFTNLTITSDLVYQTWKKPRGVTMVHVVCISGGAGGGGGFTGIAGAARGGGGGGASGSQTLVLMPAFLIPDTLYVRAGQRGIGGAANTIGTAGGISFVSVRPVAGATNLFCTTGIPVAGGPGTGSGAGAGGTSTTASTVGNMILCGLGSFTSLASHAGSAGGAHTGAIGVANTLPTTGIVVLGGTGGGGVTGADFAGGAYTPIASVLMSESIPPVAAAGSNAGSSGPQLTKPFYSFGGLGGGASNNGVGGAGGNGAIGAGGGGGGGGTTGGKGGDGGCGIVIILCW